MSKRNKLGAIDQFYKLQTLIPTVLIYSYVEIKFFRINRYLLCLLKYISRLEKQHATNQLVIQGLLRGLGLTVDLAANGEEAITTLQSISLHDLIFMDCQMPVLDGYQATEKIRDKQTGLTNSDIPIIAMTANAMEGDKQKCLDSGMDDYLSKPIDPEKVIAMLKKWLPDNNKAEIKSTNVDNETIKTREESDDEQVIFDFEEMSTRFMHDVTLIKAIPTLFYEDLVKHINDLKISIRDNNVVQATAIMHQIKGHLLM